MQAISIAIGKSGISDFCSQLVSSVLTSKLATLAPPDSTIPVPDFSSYGFGWSDSYSDISVTLSNGSLSGFNPVYSGAVQLNTGSPAGSQIQLTLTASNFTVNYAWAESYYSYFCTSDGEGGGCSGSNGSGNYSYAPQIGELSVTVTAAFTYNSGTNTYQIGVVSSSGTTSNVTPNIPSQSVLQGQQDGCFSYQVSNATASAVSNINFTSAIQAVLPAILASIPGSGNLNTTPGQVITYEFQLGDSGLTFNPVAGGNYDGILIGVSGDVAYNGTLYSTVYPGATQQSLPSLPLPAVPADSDTHDLCMYVSNFEMDGLHWAYYEAGLLNTLATAANSPDPAAFKCITYASVPGMSAYKFNEFTAAIAPQAAPLIAFQQVWSFTNDVLALLKTQLSSSDYSAIANNLTGYVFASLTGPDGLTTALTAVGVSQGAFTTVENAAGAMGMVVNQTMQLTLTIQTGVDPQPNIVFTVQRQDCMQDLSLGQTTNSAGRTIQTMGYTFVNISNVATFVSTTVAGFDDADFATSIWPTVGEPNYDNAMQAMGKQGVALPIMQGFGFTMNNAVLSIQNGYVSILTNVQVQGATVAALQREAVSVT